MLLSGCSRSHQLGVEDNPQEILNIKLNNPHAELSPNQSISLIDHCAQLGEQNATLSTDRETCLFLGNTGAGKSTTVNCLMGCEMKLVKPSELNLSGVRKVVMVEPGSTRAEVMPIGHGGQSRTFMPQIAPDPDNSNKAYCDCPGFSDNRGAEINIANAINTSRVLQQVRSIKAVFLSSYHELFNFRGNSIRALEEMCLQMFGSVGNLRRHQNAVLLGITKAPLYNGSGRPLSINTIRSRITQANTPTAQILADRIFLFDPLDRGSNNPDFWSIERCRNELDQLDSIPQSAAKTLFRAVLTGDDQTKLKHIMREQASALAVSLERDDYQAAESHWQSLAQLKVIGSAEVEKMIQELAGMPLINFVLRRVAAYEETALQYNFDEAERQLDLLRKLLSHFSDAQLEYKIKSLEALLRNSREKRRMEEESIRKNLGKTQQEGARAEREKADRDLKKGAEEAIILPPRAECCTIS
jgi:energy-coupling factor transporter ATP-binding protein EcfA2